MLGDWLLDRPQDARALTQLVFDASVIYVDNDATDYAVELNQKVGFWRQQRRNRACAIEDNLRRPTNGFASSCLADACRAMLNVDHLGRPLDSLTGRRLAAFCGDLLIAKILAMREEER